MDVQQILFYAGIACFAIAALFVVLAVVTYITQDIKGVQADLSGKARQQSIAQGKRTSKSSSAPKPAAKKADKKVVAQSSTSAFDSAESATMVAAETPVANNAVDAEEGGTVVAEQPARPAAPAQPVAFEKSGSQSFMGSQNVITVNRKDGNA